MTTDKLVLLVEDNPDDVTLTLRAFKKLGIKHRIEVARDGVEALDFLFCAGAYRDRDPHEQPQLILLDLKLPKIDGLQVLQRIRADARTRLLPVVVLTSSKQERDLVDCYGYGASSYVRKPVDFEEFVEAVRQLGIYWLTQNEPPAPAEHS